MSHETGFRRGGRDFSHRQDPKSRLGGRGSREFEERMVQRFHEHEREATETQPVREEEAPKK